MVDDAPDDELEIEVPPPSADRVLACAYCL